MVYETLNLSEVWQSYDNFMKVKLNTNTLVYSYTVRVENFEGGKFRAIKIVSYLENFAGSNSTFHVYNFRVISHPRKTRN